MNVCYCDSQMHALELCNVCLLFIEYLIVKVISKEILLKTSYVASKGHNLIIITIIINNPPD